MILAMPTIGISLAIYILITFIDGRLRQRSMQNDSNIDMASRAVDEGYMGMPTWYKNKSELDIFLKVVRAGALRKGAKERYVDAMLTITGNTNIVLRYAGALEAQGSSFIEQQINCSDFICLLLKKFESDPSILSSSSN